MTTLPKAYIQTSGDEETEVSISKQKTFQASYRGAQNNHHTKLFMGKPIKIFCFKKITSLSPRHDANAIILGRFYQLACDVFATIVP